MTSFVPAKGCKDVRNELATGLETAAKHEGVGGTGAQTSWLWKDEIVEQEFKSLKRPETSVAEFITLLKSFYCLYFGTLTDTKGASCLFANILALSANPLNSEKTFIEFAVSGNVQLAVYKAPVGLPEAFRELLSDDFVKKDISAPPPDQVIGGSKESGPNGDNETDPLATLDNGIDGERALPPSQGEPMPTPLDDRPQLMLNLKTAFEAVRDRENKSTDQGADARAALVGLTDTAIFLILTMYRRIVKSSGDLSAVFNRGNINVHYGKMILTRLCTFLPGPCHRLNMCLSSELSTNLLGGRHLMLLIFHTFLKSMSIGPAQQVGILNQTDAGLEALMRATCMIHVSGVGLTLITLFMLIRDRYGFTSDIETMAMMAYCEFESSFRRIKKFKNLQAEEIVRAEKDSSKIQPSFRLFPNSRIIHQHYHSDLSSRGNMPLCYFMACLLDHKEPPIAGTGGARMALWSRTMGHKEKETLERLARLVYIDHAEYKLSPMLEGMKVLDTPKASGEQWAAGQSLPGPLAQSDEDDDDQYNLNLSADD